MIRHWKLGFCALALVVAAQTAAAAPVQSETTKEFLAVCKTDAKGCQDYILGVRLISMMDKAKRELVCLPKNYVTAQVIKAVTGWMADHAEMANDPPSQSIEKAFLALYPTTKACRDTYVDMFPPTTEKFLAYCAKEPKDAKETCYDEIVGVGLKMTLDDRESLCRVNADVKDRKAFHEALVKRDGAIRKWLVEHTDFAAKPRRASIAAAYTALYAPPCP